MKVRIYTLAILLISTAGLSGAGRGAVLPSKGRPVLWNDPGDVRSLDLLHGSGGREHEPQPPFTFIKEDRDGASPKFRIRDRDGAVWKVKLGVEAQPEIAASRIVWAAGYFTFDEYYYPSIQVDQLPRLHRGREFTDTEGVVRGARLKREGHEKRRGSWKWDRNPFAGTREWDGLRTVMSLLNNWDLKDDNNDVVERGGESIYTVSDLGASFGTTGRSFPQSKGKGNLQSYRNSPFFCGSSQDEINFCAPSRPSLAHLTNPIEFWHRVRMEWIGNHVPRPQARWIGGILSQLSGEQLRDAFRAAGYAPDQVEGFAEVLQRRIGQLNVL